MEQQDQSLAADIVAEDEQHSTQKPANSPALKPWASLTRRQRANYQKIWSANMPPALLQDMASDDASEREIDLSKIGFGFAFSYLADVEDALEVVAIAPEQYRAWAQKASDDELRDLFSWYQENHASGE